MALLQNHRQSSAAAGLGLLESPIETFLGALHSSHALRGFRLWLSLHAAALSLWLRQLFYFATEPVSSRPSHDASPSVCTTFAATDVQVTEPPRPVQASARELASSHVVADLGGEQYYSTQTRFTVHFHDDGLREEDVEVEEEEEEVATVAAPEAADGVFEAVRSLHLPRQGRSSIDIDSSTTGDLSTWYRCQDLSVLNGSVVRFWDAGAGSRTTTSPRCRRSLSRRLDLIFI